MPPIDRRSIIRSAFASAGLAAFAGVEAAAQQRASASAPISPKDNLKITKLETFLVKPRWLFLKVHTNAGIVGLGEPITEGRALTCAEAVKEIEPYLVGNDSRRVVHHWQAIYKHAFYRGGPILTSALSGIDMALWDIKGKALGVPVYELLGGPTRRRVRVYAAARTPADVRKGLAAGFTAFKTMPAFRRKYPRYIETPAQVRYAAAARPVPRRRHHGGPADRRPGRGVLRQHRPAQPAGADLPGGRGADRGEHPELPVPGAADAGRRLPQGAVRAEERLPRRAGR